MAIPTVTAVPFTEARDRPLLVLGPSLGTSVSALWGACADVVAADLDVLGWDLPGHGANTERSGPFTIAELAVAVDRLVDSVRADRPSATWAYAGVSVGGAVGLALLLQRPSPISTAALLCTGATIGEPAGWAERARLVRTAGTAALLDSAPGRWFAPGFAERRPQVAAALLAALAETDAEGYAQVCEALAGFDARDQLAAITTPVLAIAGAHDVPTPPSSLATIAAGVGNGRLVVLERAAHLAPAERPDEVARLLLDHVTATHGAAP